MNRKLKRWERELLLLRDRIDAMSAPPGDFTTPEILDAVRNELGGHIENRLAKPNWWPW